MKELIMFKGLPACGKSTIAEKMVEENDEYVRVNRDDLRRALYGENFTWTGKKEKAVVKMEKSLAEVAIGSGHSVIVDDTNLSEKNYFMWQEFALNHQCGFRVIDLTKSVTLDTCIQRDRIRKARVGRAVIENMALRYGLMPAVFLKSKIAIWDIDGTLADISHRIGRIDSKGRAIHPTALWHEIPKDKLNTVIADWLSAVQPEMNCFVVSGRSTYEAKLTEDWLTKHSITPDRLFMRQGGDMRSDVDVKQEILNRIIDNYGKDSIAFVVDDRPSVVRLWRSNCIKTFPVNQESWSGKEE